MHTPSSTATGRWRLAFTLIELLVVLAVIGLLAGLLLPGLGRARELGRASACLGHLHQVGLALQLYVQEHGNRLPSMYDPMISTNAEANPPSNQPPTMDLVLSNYLGNPGVLRCPSDRKRLFEQTGSSYSWNSLLNGQDADHLRLMGMDFDPHQIPVAFDKEAFHQARGPKRGVNYLYADGHLKNLLAMEGGTGR